MQDAANALPSSGTFVRNPRLRATLRTLAVLCVFGAPSLVAGLAGSGVIPMSVAGTLGFYSLMGCGLLALWACMD